MRGFGKVKQMFDKAVQLVERDSIGPVGQRLRRIGVCFQKQAADTDSDGGARERSNVFALPAR